VELVIVSGLDRLFVRVLDLLPAKSQKVLYWIARVKGRDGGLEGDE
jgi:hypothetical protein